MLATAARIGVAADYTFLPLCDLDLQPLATTLLHVAALSPLGYDAFELLLTSGIEQRMSFANKVIRYLQHLVRTGHDRKQLLALFQIDVQQRVAVEVKQIEGVVHDEDALIGRTAFAVQRKTASLLHQAEGSPTLFVEGNNFSIHNARTAVQAVGYGVQFWEFVRLIVLIARNHARRLFPVPPKKEHRAVAVPLDFIKPVVIVEGVIDERG